MKSYKLLPHTADTRLWVEADSIEELFRGAMKGMTNIIKKGACDSKVETERRTIEVKSADQTALLIDFLSEVLTSSQEEGLVFCRVKFMKFSENELVADIFGRKAGGFDEDIKAVTYHEAEIKKNEKGNWETIIVFDI